MVAQADLADALKNGTIFSAGLDVMVPEPLPANDILTTLPNCGKFIRINLNKVNHFIRIFCIAYA